MIRPWWRGGELNGDHIYRDCEVLEEEGEPREGVGWLDPLGTDICDTCAERYDPDAFEERMREEYGDEY
jgi:hypothetical protein